jgi:hypothetical protein
MVLLLLRKWLVSSFTASFYSIFFSLITGEEAAIFVFMVALAFIATYGVISSLWIEWAVDRWHPQGNRWAKGMLYSLAGCISTLLFVCLEPTHHITGVTSVMLLVVPFIAILIYGVVSSLLIEGMIQRWMTKGKQWIRFILYFLAILLAHWLLFYLGSRFLSLSSSFTWQKLPSYFFAPNLTCALLFFAIDEILIRTSWWKDHKWWMVGISLLLPGGIFLFDLSRFYFSSGC